MSAPRIGISTYGRGENNAFSLPAPYVDAVRLAGGVPILLPPGETRVEAWLRAVDAVVLGGGGDIDPERYGGSHHDMVYMVDAERDTTEFALVRAVVERGVPALGICRGLQVLNVVLGGTLHEHLPDVVGETVVHRLPPREPTPHAIEVREGTRLAKVLAERTFSASSWHHQAIKRPSPELEVAAHAPDGTIEAVEKHDHPWLIAVQWHPELTALEDPIQLRLFQALVEASTEATAP